jgi:branched-chain amino acid transport system permease protein
MTYEMFVQEILSGLAMGCTYALVSFGFLLVYNAVGAVNFAHGELVQFGGYFGFMATAWFGWPLWLAFVFSLIAMAGMGIVYNKVAYYPMRHRPPVTVIVASIGMSILLRNSCLAAFGPDPVKISSFVGNGVITFGGIAVPEHYLLILLATAAIFLGQSYFFNRTCIGRKLEATAQNQETARLMGINVNWMITLTFVLSALLAAIAGFLIGPIFFLEPDLGLMVILKAFVVIVIGGFGNIRGIILGGLFLGVLEVLVASHLTSEYKDVISFLVLIFVLVFLPQGFLGEKIGQKV